MITQEQATKILRLASIYSDCCVASENEFNTKGYVNPKVEDREHSVWNELEGLITSLVEK